MSKAATKVRSKAIHARITASLLVEAMMDLILFNKKIQQIKILVKRLDDVNGNVYIVCSGRGTLKGRVINGVFHGTIKGTKNQVQAWQRFFNKFVKVPAFSLKAYVEWIRQNNNNP